MQSAAIQQLAVQRSLDLADYETEYDPDYGILWGYIRAQAGPSVTLKLLEEVGRHDRLFQRNGGRIFHDGGLRPVHYYVSGSRVRGVYSLGGDLAYFMRCIERRDREALLNYATLCVENLHPRIRNYGSSDLITVALVQGDALGGGFEGALANNVIIAEEQVKMGLPEILFNLFPGMGAYSLLARRLGPRMAEEMILSGNLYPAARLKAMGIVDIVAPEGRGELAVYDYVHKVHRRRNGVAATYQARAAVFPISREELMRITTLWVDAALRLDARDLRMMARIVHSQASLKSGEAAAPASAPEPQVTRAG